MLISILYHIALHLHVLHDEVGTVERVGHDAAHKSGSQHYCIRTLLIKEARNGLLVCKVQLLMAAAYKIVVAASLKVVPYSGTHKSVVSCNVYLAVFT